MQRIVIAVVLSGLLAACGQQSPVAGETGASAPLDFIDAVPIDKDAPPPVAQPEPVAKKDEPEEEDREPAVEEKSDAEPARPATPTPDPSSPPEPSPSAEEATRRANETVTPAEAPPAPN